MSGTRRRINWRRRACIAATFVLAAAVGGCSSGSSYVGPSAPLPSTAAEPPAAPLGDKTAQFFANSSANAPQAVANAQAQVSCPRVEVRQGASTLTVGPTGDKTAMALRYQASFTRLARECEVVGGNMVMRIGVEGRVIVGPAGGPGVVDIPLRIALVQESPGGAKPIATKFMRFQVNVPGVDGSPFSHIEEGFSFPLPQPTLLLYDYIAYVGFDPYTAQAQDQQLQKPTPKPKPRPQPKPAASTD